MKKVLIVNQHYMTGGIKKSLSNLLPELIKHYDVKVMFLCGDTSDFEKQFPGLLMPTAFLLDSVLSPLEDLKKKNGTFFRILIKTIALLFGKLFGMERIVSFCVRRMKTIGGFDCAIAYSHDNWGKNGDFFGGANQIVTEKVEAGNKLAWMHGEPETNGLTKERLHKTYKVFNRVVTVSHACKQQFDALAEGKIPCCYIRNIFDINEILMKADEQIPESTIEEALFKIVTVGRMSKVAKRSDKINEIAKLLRDSGFRFHWTVVGGGSEYDSCVKKCKEYGLENFVTYVGNQNNPYKYMKSSNIFVLVSDSEASPMVIYESLIVGTPVITTDFPAAYESIKDGYNGFVVRKDINSIYCKIADCVAHGGKLLEARKYINAHPINNDESINKILELIG